MAGVPGFEPGNAGIKNRCLTAWRYPIRTTLSGEWCGRRDLNSHTLRRQNLNLVRLPISPLPQQLGEKKTRFASLSFKIWLGYQDSNLGMPGSKPGALPLGDIPKNGGYDGIRTCDPNIMSVVL